MHKEKVTYIDTYAQAQTVEWMVVQTEECVVAEMEEKSDISVLKCHGTWLKLQ